ncbi:hypothetical protein K438DRAFT_1440395, partial [Mycena galopus ATCC 62051]
VGESIDALKAMVSPLRRLPVETIAEIFLHCRDRSLRHHDSGAPLVLTHVSSRWRQIALKTPSLWDTVRLPTSGPY